MRSPVFVPLLLCASVVWAGSGNESVLRDLGPGKKVSLALVRVVGANSCENKKVVTGMIVTGVGLLAVAALSTTHGGVLPTPFPMPQAPYETPPPTDAKSIECARYSQEMANQFLHIYEDAIEKAGGFRVTPSNQLVGAGTGKPIGLNELAGANDLFATVDVMSELTFSFGWKKKLVVSSLWRLTGPSGWQVKIVTTAESQLAVGVFPNTGDPIYKPEFLQLAHESVRLFLEQLGQAMRKAGSTATIDLAALAQPPPAESAPSSPNAPSTPSTESTSHRAESAERFVDNGDGTITDAQTGLMWAAKDNGADIDWSDAKTYCEHFRGGGHDDWRMATVGELRALFNEKESRRAACGLDVDLTSRIELSCARVWSSDSASPTEARAALFDLEDASSIPRSTSERMRALPVRFVPPPAPVAAATPSAAPTAIAAAVPVPASAASVAATPAMEASAQPMPAATTPPEAPPAAPAVAAEAPLEVATPTPGAVLHPVKLDHKWGYVDSHGRMVIPAQFDSAERFAEGRALISRGEEITVHNQYAPDSKAMHHKYGWIDEKGRTVIEPQFERADDFSEGLAPAGRALSGDGKVIKITRVLSFVDGAMSEVVFVESRFDYLDRTGKVVLHTDFEEALPFAEELAAVSPPHSGAGGTWGFIDRSGNFVIRPKFDEARSFAEGLAAVQHGNKWGFVDHDGSFSIKARYDTALSFSEGLAAVRLDSKWGYIDRTGAFVVPAQFNYAKSFADGVAPVLQGKTWGYIDKTGAFVIPAQFESARTFTGGIAAVKSGGKWGFIDRTGAFVAKPRFEDAL
jgi:hypothetical protein